jgi:hypothetical protein
MLFILVYKLIEHNENNVILFLSLIFEIWKDFIDILIINHLYQIFISFYPILIKTKEPNFNQVFSNMILMLSW